jgi:AcrR family transcriptional regulator
MNDKTADVKQELKRNRTKMYFLEAAKNMIAAEGVQSVSVRKVADAAGYAYPTLYNYFEDLNELLWETRRYMILELSEALRGRMNDPVKDSEGLKKAFMTYIEYYLENPNTFKFFYFYPLHEPAGKTKDTIGDPDFGSMWNETFKGFVASGKLREQDIEAAAKTLIYAIQGMLTLFFSGNGDLSLEANLYRDLNLIVDYLL